MVRPQYFASYSWRNELTTRYEMFSKKNQTHPARKNMPYLRFPHHVQQRPHSRTYPRHFLVVAGSLVKAYCQQSASWIRWEHFPSSVRRWQKLAQTARKQNLGLKQWENETAFETVGGSATGRSLYTLHCLYTSEQLKSSKTEERQKTFSSLDRKPREPPPLSCRKHSHTYSGRKTQAGKDFCDRT